MKSTYRKFRFTSNAGATHTPTPWRANESVFSANGMTELHIGTPEMTACVVYVDKAAPYAATQEANAAYIVKACNSHAQLVAALEATVKELALAFARAECDLRMWPISDLESIEHESLKTAARKYFDALKVARAALQSAKE